MWTCDWGEKSLSRPEKREREGGEGDLVGLQTDELDVPDLLFADLTRRYFRGRKHSSGCLPDLTEINPNSRKSKRRGLSREVDR